MPQLLEIHQNGLTLSTDPARLDLDAITDMLARAYWAQGRPRSRIERAVQNSLVFGIYDGTRMVGLARVISDYATFAYLCDVFIHEEYRGRGLGKWLMQAITGHPDLQNLRRWTLATRDAHGLYEKFGFGPLANPPAWMEIFNPTYPENE